MIPVPAFLGLAAALSGAVAACGAAAAPTGPHPPRAEGCEVTVSEEPPSVATDNIGTVNATCGDDVSDADCLRTLKDQACKLGADVVWGVSPTPKMELGKKKLSGRAAHSKVSAGDAGAAGGGKR